jgi:dipeptidyl aminopeptidase/acylaminoacyl peptidase
MRLAYPQRMSPSRRLFAATLIAAAVTHAQQPQPFTLQQILSAPYATSLTAAPVGNLFAWVEDTEGRHNLFIAGPNRPVQQLTHNTEDDAQDITQLAWSPDATAIAYTYGAEHGASGRPANPAHLQRPTPVQIIFQPVAPNAKPTLIGEGHSPLFLPDGHTLLYIHEGRIWSQDLSSSTPTQLVYDRGSASQLTLSPDGTQLAYISRRTEEAQPSHAFLALFDLRTHTLTFPAPSTSNDSAPAFSPDSHSLAWLRDPFTQPPEFANPQTTPTPWSIQLLNLTTNLTRTAFSPEPNKPGSVLPHISTGEPRLFFATTNRILFFSEDDGWVHLYSIDPTTEATPVLLTDADGEVEDVSLSGDGKQVFWASNIPRSTFVYAGLSDCMGPILGLERDDTERRHLFSVDITKPPAPKPPKANPSTNLFTEDFARKTAGEGIETHPVPLADGSLVALASDPFTPMHPVYVASDGSITDVEKDALPKSYPQKALVFPDEVSFPFADKLSAGKEKLSAQLFLPGNRKASGNDQLPWCNGHKTILPTKTPPKHPAILFLHGGPNRQMLLGYPAMDYYSNAYAMNQYLTSRGFIVLSLNYRCGIGYGLAFRDCIHAGADGATEYNDVLAAAQYLRSRPDVDPARIGIWGGSYGGYLAALALARNSNLFAAGVDFHGVHDWNLEDNAPDWRLDGRIADAQHDAIRAKALASSPLADLSHWTSPILLIHGDDDPDVAYAQTPLLADALRARNATLPVTARFEVQELIFPDEVHGFLLHKDWLAAYTAAAAFFERTLMPGTTQ